MSHNTRICEYQRQNRGSYRAVTNVGYMFDGPDSEFDIIWSLRNGITMAPYLETQFGREGFLLLRMQSGTDWTSLKDLIDTRTYAKKPGDSATGNF